MFIGKVQTNQSFWIWEIEYVKKLLVLGISDKFNNFTRIFCRRIIMVTKERLEELKGENK